MGFLYIHCNQMSVPDAKICKGSTDKVDREIEKITKIARILLRYTLTGSWQFSQMCMQTCPLGSLLAGIKSALFVVIFFFIHLKDAFHYFPYDDP